MRTITLIISLLFFQNIYAQSLDSTANVLTIKDFWQQVKAMHPSVKQAQNYPRMAAAELLSAKGGFDPKVYSNFEQKYFDKKNYFSIGEYGVKVPTWYGIEVKGSYNTTRGVFLNPEDKLPTQGQALVGVSLPLLQGLWVDERRADLFKARQSMGFNQSEQAIMLNDVAIDAAKLYWKWAFYYQQSLIIKQILTVSEQRFVAIKATFEQGDRMAMDTLEAYIQVQDRQYQYNEAILEYQNATTQLNIFLSGGKNAQPITNVVPTRNTIPPLSISAAERDIFFQNLAQTQPAIRLYQYKLAQLDIDRRLKQEKFKPKLNFNYNFLGNGFQLSNVFNDNYKWGLTFSTSTLFRAERGDVQLAKIKIENTQLQLEQKIQDLNNKLQQYINDCNQSVQQIALYQDMVKNYAQLLALENARFNLGESSLFLINSRELKYIEAQVKMAKLQMEYAVAKASVAWVTGSLVTTLE
jgi:outer membrane protein TolC